MRPEGLWNATVRHAPCGAGRGKDAGSTSTLVNAFIVRADARRQRSCAARANDGRNRSPPNENSVLPQSPNGDLVSTVERASLCRCLTCPRRPPGKSARARDVVSCSHAPLVRDRTRIPQPERRGAIPQMNRLRAEGDSPAEGVARMERSSRPARKENRPGFESCRSGGRRFQRAVDR